MIRLKRVVSRTTPGPMAAPEREVPEARAASRREAFSLFRHGSPSPREQRLSRTSSSKDSVPINQERVRKLMEHGLTEYQARVYLTLLDLGAATATQISPLSKVPRTRIY